jgi:predicted component of type VI protein secretion system
MNHRLSQIIVAISRSKYHKPSPRIVAEDTTFLDALAGLVGLSCVGAGKSDTIPASTVLVVSSVNIGIIKVNSTKALF